MVQRSTDEDLERWGTRPRPAFLTMGSISVRAVAGRPISVGVGAKPFTLRLDRSRRAKLAEVAQERGTTPSQLVRDLIDSLE